MIDAVTTYNNRKSQGGSIKVGYDVLKIGNGSIQAECPNIKIDTEGSAATDDLTTITAMGEDQRVTLRTNNSARKVTIKHAAGNIQCGADIVFNSIQDVATLVFNEGIWRLESFKSNSV